MRRSKRHDASLPAPWRTVIRAGEEPLADSRRPETGNKALRERISTLTAAILRISATLDLDTVLAAVVARADRRLLPGHRHRRGVGARPRTSSSPASSPRKSRRKPQARTRGRAARSPTSAASRACPPSPMPQRPSSSRSGPAGATLCRRLTGGTASAAAPSRASASGWSRRSRAPTCRRSSVPSGGCSQPAPRASSSASTRWCSGPSP